MFSFNKKILIIISSLSVLLFLLAPQASEAAAATGCTGILCAITCVKDGSCTLCNILDLVVDIGKFLLSIVGALAVLFVVYGGFTILLSAGIGQRVTAGKNIIINTIIGLVIALGAYVLVATAVWIATGETSVFVGSLTCGS